MNYIIWVTCLRIGCWIYELYKEYEDIPKWNFGPSSNYIYMFIFFLFRTQYGGRLLGGHFLEGNSIREKITLQHNRLHKLF